MEKFSNPTQLEAVERTPEELAAIAGPHQPVDPNDPLVDYFDIDEVQIGMDEWVVKSGRKSREGYGRVGLTRVVLDGVELDVSTVWLGLDHNFMRGHFAEGDPRPWIFESMVFGLPDSEEVCIRYATWNEAVRGHKQIMKMLETGAYRELVRGGGDI